MLYLWGRAILVDSSLLEFPGGNTKQINRFLLSKDIIWRRLACLTSECGCIPMHLQCLRPLSQWSIEVRSYAGGLVCLVVLLLRDLGISEWIWIPRIFVPNSKKNHRRHPTNVMKTLDFLMASPASLSDVGLMHLLKDKTGHRNETLFGKPITLLRTYVGKHTRKLLEMRANRNSVVSLLAPYLVVRIHIQRFLGRRSLIWVAFRPRVWLKSSSFQAFNNKGN